MEDIVLVKALYYFLEEKKTGKELRRRRSLRRCSFSITDGKVMGKFTEDEENAIYKIAADLQAERSEVVVPGRKRVGADISVE